MSLVTCLTAIFLEIQFHLLMKEEKKSGNLKMLEQFSFKSGSMFSLPYR